MSADSGELARVLESLVRRAPTAFLVVGADGAVHFANEAASALFGVGVAEIASSPLSRWLPDLRGDFDRPLAGIETEVMSGSGDRVAVEATLVPVDDGEGRAWILLQDITRRRGLEGSIRSHADELERMVTTRSKTLEEVRHRHRRLYEHAPILDFEIDSEGAIASANRKAYLSLGVPFDKLVGVPLAEVVTPDGREELRAAMENGRNGLSTPFEAKLRCADGSSLDVLFHLLPDDVTSRGSSRLLGLDVTARRDAERLVDQSLDLAEAQRARMERILRGIGEAVVVTDPDGQVRLMNGIAEKLLGIEEKWAFGRDLFSEQRDTRFVDAWAAFRGGEEDVYSTELSTETPGTTLAATLSRIRTSEGRPAGTVAVLRDVSRERRDEGRKREFVSNLAHELRGPLASIRGFASSILRGERVTPEEARRYIGIVEKEAERLGRIAEDLLALSRLDSGRDVLRHQIADAHQVMTAVEEAYGAKSKERGIEFEARADSGAGLFDVEKIRRAFDSIVQHALQSTPAGGRVQVGFRREEDRLVGSVRDTGRGYTNDELARLLEPEGFAGAGPSADTFSNLGLAIAKKLVQLHGGELTAESAPGEGATFRFWIPATPRSSAAGAPRRAPRESSREATRVASPPTGPAPTAFADALIDDV